MAALEAPVAIFEENKARAELYALWLEPYDVRVAASKQAAQEHVQEGPAVAVVDEQFADGAAETLVDIIRAESALCRVLTLTPRSEQFPDVDAELHLSKPVFEEALTEYVKRLVGRYKYHQVLWLYYRTTTKLAASDVADSAGEDVKELRDTASSLRSQLESYREQLTEEDLTAVRRSLALVEATPEAEPDVESKYAPDQCPDCSGEDDDDDTGLKRIAAYVWRCTGCGAVMMESDPGSQNKHIYSQ